MEFEGTRILESDKQNLWNLISDPEVLMKSTPGAKEVERVSETKYKGKIERGFNRITVTFDGEVEFVEFDAPDSLVADASGHDSRTNSSLDVEATMEMETVDEKTTELAYEIDMSFTGRLASLGSYIVRSKIESDIETFFDNISDRVEGETTVSESN